MTLSIKNNLSSNFSSKMESTNGKSWSNTKATIYPMISIFYYDGLWVGSSYNGLLYSTDGINWKKSNITTGKYLNICHQGGYWIASTGTNRYLFQNDETSGKLLYSLDGINWTESKLSGKVRKVCYGRGYWVAATDSGIKYVTDLAYSWTSYTESSYSNNFMDINYNGNIFVAVSREGSSQKFSAMYTATKPSAWTRNGYSSNNGSFSIQIVNGHYLVDGDAVYIFNDITGKFLGSNPSSYEAITNAKQGKNDIIVMSRETSTAKSKGLYYSQNNGNTFTQSTITNVKILDLEYANGIWIASTSDTIYYSEDGINWIDTNTPGGANKIIYANGTWIGIRDNEPPIISASFNSTTT